MPPNLVLILCFSLMGVNLAKASCDLDAELKNYVVTSNATIKPEVIQKIKAIHWWQGGQKPYALDPRMLDPKASDLPQFLADHPCHGGKGNFELDTIAEYKFRRLRMVSARYRNVKRLPMQLNVIRLLVQSNSELKVLDERCVMDGGYSVIRLDKSDDFFVEIEGYTTMSGAGGQTEIHPILSDGSLGPSPHFEGLNRGIIRFVDIYGDGRLAIADNAWRGAYGDFQEAMKHCNNLPEWRKKAPSIQAVRIYQWNGKVLERTMSYVELK